MRHKILFPLFCVYFLMLCLAHAKFIESFFFVFNLLYLLCVCVCVSYLEERNHKNSFASYAYFTRFFCSRISQYKSNICLFVHINICICDSMHMNTHTQKPMNINFLKTAASSVSFWRHKLYDLPKFEWEIVAAQAESTKSSNS